MKSAIILIDCWGYGFDWLPLVPERKMYKNIVRFIKNSTADDVILASYDGVDELLNNNTIWYTNSKKRLKTSQLLHKIELYKEGAKKLTKRLLIPYTVKQILNAEFEGKNQFSAHYPFELFDSYDRVYLCGKAFELCVTNRPLGIKYFDSIGVEVYVDSRCVLTAKSKVPTFDKNWKPITENLYRYTNNIIDSNLVVPSKQ